MRIPYKASQAAKGVNAGKKGSYQGIERETLETHFLKSKNLQLKKRVCSRSLPCRLLALWTEHLLGSTRFSVS